MGQLRLAEPRPEVVADRADSPDGSPQQSTLTRGEASEQALSTSAVLVGAEGCLWQVGGDTVELRRGLELHAADSLKLLAGTAHLQFADGAVVLLEGPAQFTIEEAGRGKLDRGKLVAHVPPQAIGFTVATPNSAVVDLGTEFGVEVAENGATEVHVLRGMVEFASRDGLSESGSLPTPTRLSAGEAARVDVASAEPVAIRFAADKFDAVAAAPLRPSHAALRPVDLSRATATQPSAWHESPSDFAAPAAIDGNDRTFSHTSGDDQLAWWQLDLGSVQPLVAAVLHNRRDVCRGWLRDIQVKVLAEDGETVVFTSRIYNPRNALTGDENNFREGPDLLEIELRSEAGTPALGRFVRVERLPCTFLPKVWWGDKKSKPLTEAMLKAAKGALVLSEVEVYAAATEENELEKAAGESDRQNDGKDASPRGR